MHYVFNNLRFLLIYLLDSICMKMYSTITLCNWMAMGGGEQPKFNLIPDLVTNCKKCTVSLYQIRREGTCSLSLPKKFSGGGVRRRPLPLPLFAPDPTYKILHTNFYKILTLDVHWVEVRLIKCWVRPSWNINFLAFFSFFCHFFKLKSCYVAEEKIRTGWISYKYVKMNQINVI